MKRVLDAKLGTEGFLNGFYIQYFCNLTKNVNGLQFHDHEYDELLFVLNCSSSMSNSYNQIDLHENSMLIMYTYGRELIFHNDSMV